MVPARPIEKETALDAMIIKRPHGVRSEHAVLKTVMPVVRTVKNLWIRWNVKSLTTLFQKYLHMSSGQTGLHVLGR